MTLTNLISFLAFIVALYSAILSTILFFKEKLNLKLIYLDKNYFFFSKKDECISNHGYLFNRYYKDSYSIAIKVRILNNSKLPTTINEFILNGTIHIDNSSMIDKIVPTSFSYCDDYVTYESAEEVDILQPLITLNPYDSIEGYLIFNNIKLIPSKIKISINAVQKEKSFKLNLKLNDCTKLIK